MPDFRPPFAQEDSPFPSIDILNPRLSKFINLHNPMADCIAITTARDKEVAGDDTKHVLTRAAAQYN